VVLRSSHPRTGSPSCAKVGRVQSRRLFTALAEITHGRRSRAALLLSFRRRMSACSKKGIGVFNYRPPAAATIMPSRNADCCTASYFIRRQPMRLTTGLVTGLTIGGQISGWLRRARTPRTDARSLAARDLRACHTRGGASLSHGRPVLWLAGRTGDWATSERRRRLRLPMTLRLKPATASSPASMALAPPIVPNSSTRERPMRAPATRPIVNIDWFQNRLAELWLSGHDTADMAVKLKAREAVVANWLADMRDRSDPRLRKSVSR
jgi:hypothetical protein